MENFGTTTHLIPKLGITLNCWFLCGELFTDLFNPSKEGFSENLLLLQVSNLVRIVEDLEQSRGICSEKRRFRD